jgi:hypothetical protein
MKRAIVLLAVFLVLFGTMLPSPVWAGGSWHGGYYGGYGGWWWPGAIIGGLALGAVAIVTAPFLALSAVPAYPPPVAYAPPMVYATPPVYSVPPRYSPPPTTYQQAPNYAAPRASAIQREVVYPNGRYVLHGDGVHQPWQWVWVPSASPPPPPPPPQ